MTEEKNIFDQENMGENLVDANSERVNATDNSNEMNENVQSFESVNNPFLYSSSPMQYTTEQAYTTPVQSEVVYDSQPTVTPVVAVEEVKPEPVEEKVLQVESIEEKKEVKSVVKAEDEMMDKDLKGNLTFIIVLAVIMIAMIVVLPYISKI